MKKLILFFIVLILIITGVIAGPADDKNDILVKLNFYEGLKGEEVKGESVVSTYFLKPLFVGKIHIESSGKSESAEIKKIFNLSGINLMSEAKWGWRSGEKKKEFQLLILNGKEFMVEIMMKELPDNFIVIVSNRQNRKILLKTDIILPEKRSSVFGFEDSRGKPFFLSLSRAAGESIIRKEPRVKKIAKVKNPVLIKKVKPVYPREALRRKISGVVLMEAVCDIYGRVVEVKIIQGEPLLNSAAVNSVKQWVYEPYLINNVPKPVRFTVIMKFRLDTGKKKTKKTVVKKRMKLIKGAIPVYPDLARKSRLSGNVILDAIVDKNGNVSNVKVLSGNPILIRAAVENIRFWKYLVEKTDKKFRDINIRITFKFRLGQKTIVNSVNKNSSSGNTPNIWPTRGYLTLTFGDERKMDERGRVVKQKGKVIKHKGVDIAAKRGSKVIAPASGKVIDAKFTKRWGKYLIIDHGNGYVSKYAHLDELMVKKRDNVEKGDLIGLVGNTGVSTGPHLHWEVHFKGNPVNPLELLKK